MASGIYSVFIYTETKVQGFVAGMSAVSCAFLIHFEYYSAVNPSQPTLCSENNWIKLLNSLQD